MECKPSPKILQLMQYASYHPFLFKYQDFGPPETSSGTALFVISMIVMPTSILLFVMPLGTGLDKSARGLAALHYEMLPATGEVVCNI